ncbi:MAG: hypothetical protein DYG89_05630 [Caldilinea sp. CFX5]|nr:hypothetical protein [Caldilinea sp. CFX5]
MKFQRYQHYLYKIRTNPPSLTFQKAIRKIANRLSTTIDRVRVQWSSTPISDANFVAALDPNLPTIEALLAQITQRSTPRFFISARAKADILSTLPSLCPQSSTLIIETADTVCHHIFDLLGSGPHFLGEVIDWHTDFKSGYRWHPRQYCADIRSAPYPGGYDLKMPWELSRCQHFAWLGQAYWLTSNEKYAQEFVTQITSWIAQNPVRLGVNWACTMDVAIRAVNWLWGYYFFQNSPSLTTEFLSSFFNSLLQHGRHILNNLEVYEGLTSNHYLSDIVGLVYLGILLPEFKEAYQWRSFALQELEKEIRTQVYTDGMVFEASVNYHRLSTELFLSATILAHLNGHQFSVDYMARLEKMIEFTMLVTKPDGTVPLIGDCDNGRLHRLKAWGGAEREWFEHRHLLAIGAILFDRLDFAHAAGDQWEEALWIWGAEKVLQKKAQLEHNEGTRLPPICLFPQAGLTILRHKDQYMAIVAGPNGQNGNGGHAHNDKLSFEFYAAGQSWLVDPGVYLYTADHKQRNLFRSTAYHNTVYVADQEQNRFLADPSYIFQLHEDAKPRVCQFELRAETILWVGEHYGYQRLSPPVIHRRTIFMHGQSSIWLLQDQIIGREQHRCITHFHLAPLLDVTIDERGAVITQREQRNAQQLWLLPLKPVMQSPVVNEGWVSKGYGVREVASILAWEWPKETDTTLWAICAGGSFSEVEQQVATALHDFCRSMRR